MGENRIKNGYAGKDSQRLGAALGLTAHTSRCEHAHPSIVSARLESSPF